MLPQASAITLHGSGYRNRQRPSFSQRQSQYTTQTPGDRKLIVTGNDLIGYAANCGADHIPDAELGRTPARRCSQRYHFFSYPTRSGDGHRAPVRMRISDIQLDRQLLRIRRRAAR